jgi:hypothetical protein
VLVRTVLNRLSYSGYPVHRLAAGSLLRSDLLAPSLWPAARQRPANASPVEPVRCVVRLSLQPRSEGRPSMLDCTALTHLRERALPVSQQSRTRGQRDEAT